MIRLLLLIAVLVTLGVGTLAWAAGPTGGGVDPRTGGLEVGLGEWAVALEAKAIRPGSVTFVVSNQGRHVHGFRIRSMRADGRGRGGDRFEARTVYLRSARRLV